MAKRPDDDCLDPFRVECVPETKRQYDKPLPSPVRLPRAGHYCLPTKDMQAGATFKFPPNTAWFRVEADSPLSIYVDGECIYGCERDVHQARVGNIGVADPIMLRPPTSVTYRRNCQEIRIAAQPRFLALDQFSDWWGMVHIFYGSGPVVEVESCRRRIPFTVWSDYLSVVGAAAQWFPVRFLIHDGPSLGGLNFSPSEVEVTDILAAGENDGPLDEATIYFVGLGGVRRNLWVGFQTLAVPWAPYGGTTGRWRFHIAPPLRIANWQVSGVADGIGVEINRILDEGVYVTLNCNAVG